MTLPNFDKVAGALFGTAIGDALGRNTEFSNIKSIYNMYGRRGHMNLPKKAYVTDDTHMTLYTGVAVVRGLSNSATPRSFSRELRRSYIRWLRDPNSGPGRAPGASCITAVRGLENYNLTWQQATTLSKGCGANMRVAPIAFAPREMIPGLAQQSAAMTHGHPLSLAAAELTALAIYHAANGVPMIDILDWMIRYSTHMSENPTYHGKWLGRLSFRWGLQDEALAHGWRENTNMLLKVWLRLSDPDNGRDACIGIGQAWVAHEALAVAMYCAIRHQDDPIEGISRGARTSGDSDSIASITGSLLGAYHGMSAWPAEWVERIEFRDALNGLARDLADGTSKHVDHVDELLDTATPIPVKPIRGYAKFADKPHGGSDWESWWLSRLDSSAQVDDTRLVDLIPTEWDNEIPDVTRRPNGTIDHSYCSHGSSKAARARCRRRNRNI